MTDTTWFKLHVNGFMNLHINITTAEVTSSKQEFNEVAFQIQRDVSLAGQRAAGPLAKALSTCPKRE